MIGQRELVKKIDQQIANDKFPRFVILVGERGSGKKLLSMQIASKLGATLCVVGTKAEDVRTVIENSYKVGDLKVMYLVANADNMSALAANALLKVTEEVPNKAYFILTCENADNLLPTIKSRGVTYMLEPYSYSEKCDFVDTACEKDIDDDVYSFILEVCSTIGDIQQMLNMDVVEFKNYVNLVIDNIAEVSGSNAFKIADKVALKDEEDKYDFRLFLKAFSCLCIDRMAQVDVDNPIMYARGVAITGDILQQLSIRGINKTMLFDSWLLNIREEWYDNK